MISTFSKQILYDTRSSNMIVNYSVCLQLEISGEVCKTSEVFPLRKRLFVYSVISVTIYCSTVLGILLFFENINIKYL